MTIKQQGGIFGRNPTFNNVTTDGAVTFQGSSNPTVTFRGDASNQNTIPYGSIEFYNADISAAGPNIAAGIKVLARNANGSGGEIAFFTSDGTQGEGVAASETVRVNGLGNIVIQNSGSGIDFSATSGTGTSELFDDYEEGTWTPTLTTDGTDFDSVTYDPLTNGYYTKVGDLVVARGRLRTDAVTVGSASGNVLIGGLPFTVGGGVTGRASAFIGVAEDFSTNNPSGGRTTEDTATFKLLYRSSANGAATDLPVSSVDTGANKNHVSFTVIYRV